MDKFNVGDIVRLKTGSARIKVTAVNTYNLRGYYTDCGMNVPWRQHDHFVLVTAAKVVPTTADPYTHRDEYSSLGMGGTRKYIGHTTSGLLVLEDFFGGPFATSPADWEKVVPFTFQVKWTKNDAYSTFAGTQGDVALRDRLIDSEGYECMVTGINTQSNATQRFVGKRYVLEDIK